jgi:hypothetical protein
LFHAETKVAYEQELIAWAYVRSSFTGEIPYIAAGELQTSGLNAHVRKKIYNAAFSAKVADYKRRIASAKAKEALAATVRNNAASAQGDSAKDSILQAPGTTLQKCDDPTDEDCD